MKKWEKAEKKDAELFGTKQQRGSGRVDHYPTDSFSDDFAIDSKYTDKKSYSISISTWNKLCEEAAILQAKDHTNRIPLLSLHIKEEHLVVMAFEDLQRFLKRVEEAEEFAWRYKKLLD